jgi:hypothetical protein
MDLCFVRRFIEKCLAYFGNRDLSFKSFMLDIIRRCIKLTHCNANTNRIARYLFTFCESTPDLTSPNCLCTTFVSPVATHEHFSWFKLILHPFINI